MKHTGCGQEGCQLLIISSECFVQSSAQLGLYKHCSYRAQQPLVMLEKVIASWIFLYISQSSSKFSNQEVTYYIAAELMIALCVTSYLWSQWCWWFSTRTPAGGCSDKNVFIYLSSLLPSSTSPSISTLYFYSPFCYLSTFLMVSFIPWSFACQAVKFHLFFTAFTIFKC